MTASDAKAYCLAVAQLIPILLIALYIVDYSWLTKSENATRAAEIETGYAQRAIWGILAGIAGEVIVLGGAIGLYSRLVAIAAGTGIVIYAIGVLSEPAVDRLSWKRNSAFYRLLRNRLLPITIIAALAASGYIFFRVRIVS